MIEWAIDLAFAPIAWGVGETLVFAITAPIEHIYIALGTSAFLATLLIWSMLPRKVKSQNVEPATITPYQATEEDEREAREILIGMRTI